MTWRTVHASDPEGWHLEPQATDDELPHLAEDTRPVDDESEDR